MRSVLHRQHGLKRFRSWAQPTAIHLQSAADRQYMFTDRYHKLFSSTTRTYALLSSREAASSKELLKFQKRVISTVPRQDDNRERLSRLWIPSIEGRKVKDVTKGKFFDHKLVTLLKINSGLQRSSRSMRLH